MAKPKRRKRQASATSDPDGVNFARALWGLWGSPGPESRRAAQAASPVAKPERRERQASDAADPAGVNFARAVYDLYHQLWSGIKPDVEISSLPEEDREPARSAAHGMFVLRKLLAQGMSNSALLQTAARPDITGYGFAGLVHAYQVLDCLIEGSAGPIRRYIAHLGAGGQAKVPNRIELARRGLVVGVVLAIQTAAKSDGVKITRRQATDLVLEACPFIAQSNDTVKGWIRRAAPQAHSARDNVLRLAREARSNPNTPLLPFRLLALAEGTLLIVTLFSTEDAMLLARHLK
jgi:hypothetical protein